MILSLVFWVCPHPLSCEVLVCVLSMSIWLWAKTNGAILGSNSPPVWAPISVGIGSRSLLWTKSISHHLETMAGNYCWLVFPLENHSRGWCKQPCLQEKHHPWSLGWAFCPPGTLLLEAAAADEAAELEEALAAQSAESAESAQAELEAIGWRVGGPSKNVVLEIGLEALFGGKATFFWGFGPFYIKFRPCFFAHPLRK